MYTNASVNCAFLRVQWDEYEYAAMQYASIEDFQIGGYVASWSWHYG